MKKFATLLAAALITFGGLTALDDVSLDIPAGSIYISATGLVQGKKKLQLTSVSSLLAASGYHFDEALFANGKLNLKTLEHEIAKL